jgi:hypothetical protein
MTIPMAVTPTRLKEAGKVVMEKEEERAAHLGTNTPDLKRVTAGATNPKGISPTFEFQKPMSSLIRIGMMQKRGMLPPPPLLPEMTSPLSTKTPWPNRKSP